MLHTLLNRLPIKRFPGEEYIIFKNIVTWLLTIFWNTYNEKQNVNEHFKFISVEKSFQTISSCNDNKEHKVKAQSNKNTSIEGLYKSVIISSVSTSFGHFTFMISTADLTGYYKTKSLNKLLFIWATNWKQSTLITFIECYK